MVGVRSAGPGTSLRVTVVSDGTTPRLRFAAGRRQTRLTLGRPRGFPATGKAVPISPSGGGGKEVARSPGPGSPPAS